MRFCQFTIDYLFIKECFFNCKSTFSFLYFTCLSFEQTVVDPIIAATQTLYVHKRSRFPVSLLICHSLA